MLAFADSLASLFAFVWQVFIESSTRCRELQGEDEMGTIEVVLICGVLPGLWVWLLCRPKREPQRVEAQRDWRDNLDWRK